jgi:hypothetical protein
MKVTSITMVYVIGAAVDAVVGTLLLFPSALAEVVGLAEVPSRLSERVALAMTASLLIGWAALLLWAMRSPIERRGVLLLTVFPVITGLGLAVALGWNGSYISTVGAAMIWTSQGLLIGLFAWGYASARRGGKQAKAAQ